MTRREAASASSRSVASSRSNARRASARLARTAIGALAAARAAMRSASAGGGPAGQFLEVGAGAEGAVTGAGEDRGLHGRVAFDPGDERGQRTRGLGIDRVARAGPVDGEHGDLAVVLAQHGLRAHATAPPPRRRWMSSAE